MNKGIHKFLGFPSVVAMLKSAHKDNVVVLYMESDDFELHPSMW
jgi:hypothetical protein